MSGGVCRLCQERLVYVIDQLAAMIPSFTFSKRMDGTLFLRVLLSLCRVKMQGLKVMRSHDHWLSPMDVSSCASTVDYSHVCCFSHAYLSRVFVGCRHMNWHIEHHMYAAVPCYNLRKLHDEIEHDLPPTPKGLVEMWLQIRQVVEKQRKD